MFTTALTSDDPEAVPRRKNMRPSGIEPEAIAWEAMILPLNQERATYLEKYVYVYRNSLKSDVVENVPPHFSRIFAA